jgi:hypothetical protein
LLERVVIREALAVRPPRTRNWDLVEERESHAVVDSGNSKVHKAKGVRGSSAVAKLWEQLEATLLRRDPPI